jgi:mycoredoxin
MAPVAQTVEVSGAPALRDEDHDRPEDLAVSAVTMYTTTWCGYCTRLKAQMARAGITFVEVDIEQDDAAAEVVEGVNGGNQTVPTIVFPDGSALTNPAIGDVAEKLASIS